MRTTTTMTLKIAVITLALVVHAHGGVPFSDFEDGTLQGWEGVALAESNAPPPIGWSLVASGSGNPGFCMAATDTQGGGSTLFARAPVGFTGDLSVYAGLQWDEFIPNNGASTRNPTFLYLLGADGTRFYHGASNDSLDNWRTRFAPFQTNAWVKLDGTASFEAVLANVQSLFIYMETADIAPVLESRVDNIALVPGARLRIRISQIELCWDTVTNFGYQLQYRSVLTTNEWLPFSSNFVRGTGGTVCSNDAVFANQSQRYYRLVITNQVTEP